MEENEACLIDQVITKDQKGGEGFGRAVIEEVGRVFAMNLMSKQIFSRMYSQVEKKKDSRMMIIPILLFISVFSLECCSL